MNTFYYQESVVKNCPDFIKMLIQRLDIPNMEISL